MLEHIILGFLNEQEMTGYEIKTAMEESTANFVDASFGSIYPALKRLDIKGSIRFSEEMDGGKYKKRYRITESGKMELMAWLRQPVEFSPLKYEYLAKLFFYRFLDLNEVIPLLTTFISTVENKLEVLEKQESDCSDQMNFFGYATLRFGKELYGTIIKWHEGLIRELEINKID